MTSALNFRCAGTASTSSASSTYGGLQSDSQATAAIVAAAGPPPNSNTVARKPATIVSASADHEPKRNSDIGSSATARKCSRNGPRAISAIAITQKRSVANRPAKNEKYGRMAAARATAAATICGTYVAGE